MAATQEKASIEAISVIAIHLAEECIQKTLNIAHVSLLNERSRVRYRRGFFLEFLRSLKGLGVL